MLESDGWGRESGRTGLHSVLLERSGCNPGLLEDLVALLYQQRV